MCAYCDTEITDNNYIYMWFPEAAEHKPVHSYHIKGMRKRPNSHNQGGDRT